MDNEKITLLYFIGMKPVAESGVLLRSGEPLTDEYINSLSDEERDLLACVVRTGCGGIGLEGFDTDPRLRPTS